MTIRRGLYRALFGPGTITLEGVLLLIGLALLAAGRLGGWDSLVTAGLWCAAPFLVTVAVSLLVLAPWFWLRDRRRRSWERR